jgi:hypothetical protein
MTTASDLADELEGLFYRAADAAHGDVPALIQRFFEDRGNEILSALRRVETATLLFGRVIDDDHAVVCQECAVVQDGSQLLADIEEFLGRKYCRPIDTARQALTGEA